MSIPFSTGTPECFSRVRNFFRSSGFVHEGVYTGGDALDFAERVESAGWDTPRQACERLFLSGGVVPVADLKRLAGSDVFEDLQSLGLLEFSPDGGTVQGSARICPMHSVWVVSDAMRADDSEIADDFVYPPDIENTQRFLSFIPNRPSERFLEVCAGSGVAALIAAHSFARQAWSADLAQRSTDYATFGARLNGLENFTAITGDTMKPAAGLSFDTIVAHPPQAAVPKHTWLYHDGGLDGSTITRTLIGQVPEYLEPGGRFLCKCLAVDRTGLPFELQVRRWLGVPGPEFDIATIVLERITLYEYIKNNVEHGRITGAEADDWGNALLRDKVTDFLPSLLLIRRRTNGSKPVTLRSELPPTADATALEQRIDSAR